MHNNIQEYTSSPDSFREYFSKIWRYKTLIWVFAKRDLQVKYSQTVLGIAWSVLQPLTSLAVYTLFFGYLLKWESDGISYPVYVLSGLLGWNYFSYIVNAGTFGLQESAHLIKKIYFPKSIIPLSKMLVAMLELGISTLLLIPLMLYYEQNLSWNIVFLPFVLLYNTMCALMLVFWISVFAYKKRDVLHLIPFLLYFGIWFSPVFFSSDILPEQFAFVLDLNPMANVIQLWRYVLFDFGEFKWIWGVNFLLVMVLLFMGMYIYNRKESEMADYA